MTISTTAGRKSLSSISRLHALDTEFLWIEDVYSPMCIGSLSVFEGPVPSRDEVERFAASRLDAAPANRKRLRFVPLGLGRPVLIDDVHFDISYHVRQVCVPAPYTDAALWELMGTLLATPLDRKRPLWQMYIVDGLPEGRWALITKIHHAIVDGIAGIGVLAAVLSDQPAVQSIEPSAWQPAPEPSRSDLLLDAFSGLRQDAKTWLGALRSAAKQPRRTSLQARDLGVGLYKYLRRFVDPRTSSLQGRVHERRRYTSVAVQLDDMRRIHHAFRCTINDVVLALLTNGYRAMLEYRGDDLGRARVGSLVPVSVRLPDIHGIEGNRVSAVFCELPVHIAEPRQRLEEIVRRMKQAKASHMIEAGAWFTEILDLAPPLVVRAVSRAIVRGMHRFPQHALTTVTTNVAGPQCPLYFRGRRMLSFSPYVPISQGARMGSAVLSYNGALTFGITADFDSVHHLEVFARAIEADLGALLSAASLPAAASEVEASK